MTAIHCDMTPMFRSHELSFAQRCKLVAQAGFDGITLWYGDDYGEVFRSDNYPASARACGLRIENVHAPFKEVNHIWEDTHEGQRVFENYLRCIEDCAAYEIPTMVMHPNFGCTTPSAVPLGLARFEQIARKAEQYDVNVAIENMRNPEQISRAADLLGRIDSPYFGLCFDSGHFNAQLSREPEMNMLARFGHRLMALHLHDNEGCVLGTTNDDQHRLPFDGTIDWPQLMRAIAATGYRGPTSLEVMNGGHESLPPEEFLVLAYERARRLEELRV